MKGGCDLNERLKEAFLRFAKCEPDAFPMLMSIEILAASIAAEAFSESTAVPVQKHRFRITGDVARIAAGSSSAAPTWIDVESARYRD